MKYIINLKFKMLLLILFGFTLLKGQTLLWRYSTPGNTGDLQPYKSVVDDNNNFYMIGWFRGNVTVGTNTYTVKTANYNGVIAKYDKDGGFKWSRNIGGWDGDDYVVGVDVSNDNSKVYVLAEIVDSLKIDGTFYNVVTDGSYDLYVIEFDAANGNINSTHRIFYGNTGFIQRGSALRVDYNGNIIVSANTSASSIQVLDSAIALTGGYNCLLMKFSNAFIRKPGWPKIHSSTNTSTTKNRFNSIEVTQDAYYVSGIYYDKLFFDKDTLISTTQGIFLYKLDTSGNGKWVRKLNGPGDDFSVSCAYDGDRSIYISGYTASSYLRVDSASGANDTSKSIYSAKGLNDVIFARYDTSGLGLLQWYNRFGSGGDDRLTRVYANPHYVLIAGQYGGTINFPGQQITTKGGQDALGLIFDKNNNLVHALNVGGTGSDIGETGFIDSEGSYYFMGDFKSSKLYIGNDSSLTNATIATKDMFMVKFDKMILSAVTTNPKCYGSTDGSINLSITGSGVPPYQYSWNGGTDITQDLSNKGAGQYIVIVTDSMLHSVTDTFILTNPTQLTSSGSVLTHVECKSNSTGSARLTASGGTGTKTYNINSGAYQPSNTFTGLTAGDYTLGVKDSLNCTSTSPVTITEPALALTAVASSDPITLPGGTDGSATLAATGGTTPYQYQLNSGSWQGGNTFTGLGAGIYTLTVKDNKNCSASDETTIGLFSITITKTDITCIDSIDGTATASITGGSGPFHYLWSNGDTIATADTLGVGSYTLRVIDINPDTVYSSVTISQPSAISSVLTATDVSCEGGSNGSISQIVSGGVQPYSFSWTKDGSPISDITKNISGLTLGSYEVTITDKNNCPLVKSGTLIELSHIWVGLTTTHQTCYGGTNNGSITSSVTGAYGSVSYLWSYNNQTTANISNIPPDSYTLTVTDNAGCTADSTTVVNPGPQILGSISSQNVTCYGYSNGQATMNPTFQGGRTIGPYLWNTSPPSSAQTVTNLYAQTYTCIVKDNLNCEQSFSKTITQPPALGLTEKVLNHINVSCNGGSDGVLEVRPSGGSGLYEFQINSGSWANDSVFSGRQANFYQVNVRDKNVTFCSYTGLTPIEITQPNAINISNVSTTDILCKNENSGSITITANGGTGTLQYSIDNGGNWSSGNSFTSLDAGNYSIRVKDANNCEKSYSGNPVSVIEPATLPLISNVTPTDVTCTGGSDGQIVVTAAGGTGLLDFSIDYGSSWQFNNGNFSSLSAGNYNIVIRDANNCRDTFSLNPVVLTELHNLPTSSLSGSATICNGASTNLSVALTGTQPWNLTWFDGSSHSVTGITGSPYLISVSPSSTTIYTITALNDANCTASVGDMTGSATVTVNPLPTVTATATPATICVGASSSLSASGASTYSWDNGLGAGADKTVSPLSTTTYTVTGTDVNGCVNTASASVTVNPLPTVTATATPATICIGASSSLSASGASTYSWDNGLGAGTDKTVSPLSTTTYTVTGTDVNGCVNTASASVTVNPLPTVTATATPATICVGASSSLSASGASTYSWDNGLGAGANKTVSPLSTTTYTVTGTDVNGCVNTASASVTVNPLPTVTATATPATICNGESSSLSASGASTYNWDNGLGAGANKTVSPLSTTTYTVTGTDVNGCVNTASASVTVNPLPTVTATATPATICVGASSSLSASGASTYNWDNGLGAGANKTVSPLSTATYLVTGTDVNGCVNTASALVTVNSLPAAPTITTSGSTTFCEGGTVTLTSSTGSTYLWSTGAVTSSIDVTASGSYTVQITDGSGCQSPASAATTVTVNPLPLAPSITPGGPTTFCEGGTVTLTSSTGSTYLWSTGAVTSSIDVTASGSYTVQITDGSGCQSPASAATTVTVNPLPLAPSITPGGPTTFCEGGTVTLTSSTGSTYLWSTGAVTSSIDVTASGSYTVQITDGSGCQSPASAATTVTVNPLPLAPSITPGGPTTFCEGGTVTLTSSTGSTYLWSTGAVTSSIDVTASGSYTVQITDGSGCQSPASAATTVTVNPLPLAPSITPGGPTTFCEGGTVTLTSSTGSTYLWSTGAVTSSIDVTASGSYTVQITDGSGCQSPASDATVVTADPLPSAPTITASGPTSFCEGGTVTLTSSTGSTYLWSTGAVTSSIDVTASGSFTVQITDGSGCQSLTSDPAVVTVYTTAPAPTITAGGPTSFCEGGTVTLTSSTGSTYLWSTGAVTSSIDVTASGSFTVQITDGSGCQSLTSYPAVVTVYTTAPAPTITAGGPTSFCEGGTVTLTSSTGSTYLWSTGAVTSSIDVTASGSFTVQITDGSGCQSLTSEPAVVTVYTTAPAPTITAGGPVSFCEGGTVTLTSSTGSTYLWSTGAVTSSIDVTASGSFTVQITDGSGCQSLTSDPAVVTVYTTAPAPTITAGGPTSFCEGGTVTLTSSTGSTYLWSTGAVTSSIDVTASGSYTVQITDGSGCQSLTSDPAVVTVYTTAPAPTITAGGPTSFCEGGTVTLTSSTGSTYLWSTGAVTSSIDVTASGSFTVQITDGSGCQSLTSEPAVVTVYTTAPAPTITAVGPTSFCEGGTVTLTSSTGSTYLWSTGAVTSSIDVTASGSYTVQIIDGSGCQSPASDATAVTVIGNSITIASVDKSDASGLNIQDGRINVVAGGGSGSFTFTLNPGTIVNSTGIFDIKPGTYNISVTDENNCETVTSNDILVGYTIGIGNIASSKIELFPNPNKGKFMISYYNPVARSMNIEIFNVLGVRVFSKEYKNKLNNSFSTDIELTDTPKGIYIIKVNNKVYTERMVIR